MKRISSLLLCLGLAGCLAQPEQPRLQVTPSDAVLQMAHELKGVANLFSSAHTDLNQPATQLLSGSADKLAVQSPSRAIPDFAKNDDWFVAPGLIGLIECEHCRALHNVVSSEYGNRVDPKRRGIRHHNGIDVRAPIGSAVLAFKGGEIIYAGRFSSYGLTVEIRQYDGHVSRYAHLNKILVQKGQVVEAGFQVGEVGRTGRTTGPHLHFELLRDGDSLDPQLFLARIEQIMRCSKTGLSADN